VQLPDPTLGLLIIAARHAIRHAISGRARKLRLTTQQFWGIYCLRQVPGLTPGELGQWMLLDAPAASRLVADLSKRKLIDVRPDREDRRRMRLFLTEKGEGVAEKAQAIADEYQSAITRGMDAEELRAVRTGLMKVVENLRTFDGDPPDSAAPRRSDRVARTGS
jgi:DNA-binding MarR family transcriptional regulator